MIDQTLSRVVMEAYVRLGFKYDTSKNGLSAIFKPYEIHALQVLWETPGMLSKDVWLRVNQLLDGDTISRTSIIIYLEDLRKKGLLNGVEVTGKGGRYYRYSVCMDEAEFKVYLVSHFIEALRMSFGAETLKVVTE